jgi:hypothetical protein
MLCRARKKAVLAERERNFSVRSSVGASRPEYDALTDIHCQFVERRSVYKTVMQTVKVWRCHFLSVYYDF